MTGRYGLTLAIALCGAVAMTAADAVAAKRVRVAGPPPVARGCTNAIAPFCMGVTSRGTTYALFGAIPFIPPGIGVDVWGTVTPGLCGTTIQVSSWSRNALRCP
jgi:hypothetical protein